MANYAFFSDVRAFWRKEWSRAVLLILSSALILSLLVTVFAIRSTLFNLPPAGTSPVGDWVTLGARLPDGRFGKVGLNDLRQLDTMGYAGRWVGYATTDANVSLGAQSLMDTSIAAVSPTLFDHLRIHVRAGWGISKDHAGAVISWRFYERHFGSPREALGTSISIGDRMLPIIGVLAPKFSGFGEGDPSVYIPEADLAAAESVDLPLSPAQLTIATQQLLPQLPLYHGFVHLQDVSEARDLRSRWRVRNSEYISIDIPATSESTSLRMKLGFSTLGNKAQIVRGIDLDPSRTALITRFLGIVGAMALVAFALLCLELAAFWVEVATSRIQEYRVRVSVGANWGNLMSLCLRESAPFVVAIVLGTVILISAEFQLLSGVEPFASALKAKTGSLSAAAVFPVAAAMVLVLVIATGVPLASIAKSLRVGGGMGGSRSLRIGRFVARAVTWGGLVLTAYVVSVALIYAAQLGRISWGGNGDPLSFGSVSPGLVSSIREALDATADDLALVDTPPLSPLQNRYSFLFEQNGRSRTLNLAMNAVSPTFFRVARIDLVAGKSLTQNTRSNVVLSDSVARFLKMDPQELVGRQLIQKVDDTGKHDVNYVITGVVSDVKYGSLVAAAPMVVYRLMPLSPHYRKLLVNGRYKPYLREKLVSRSPSGALGEALNSAKSLSVILDARVGNERKMLLATVVFGIVLLITILVGLLSDIAVFYRQVAGELALKFALGSGLWRGIFAAMRVLLAATACGVVAAVAISYPTTRLMGVVLHHDGWMAWVAVGLVLGGALVGVCCYFRIAVLSKSLLDRLRTNE